MSVSEMLGKDIANVIMDYTNIRDVKQIQQHVLWR